MVKAVHPHRSAGVLDELARWLEDEWDPDLSVGEWWSRLGRSGWAAPSWPWEWYGRGLSAPEAKRVAELIEAHGALGAPGGIGLSLAGPTILEYGTDDQKRRYLADIVTGRRAWCQLFSEPGAGSDLASVACRAERDGDGWVITGQKVWTSGGHFADLAMLLARTDPTAPKHHGLTWFVLEMDQSGVEVRPLREMTGRSLFNEVFLDGARVRLDAVVGGVNDGWRVARTTLAFERSGLGAGAGMAAGARPGSRAGDLGLRAGDRVKLRRDGGGDPVGNLAAGQRVLRELAAQSGRDRDPIVRQCLADLYIRNEVNRLNLERAKAGHALGRASRGLDNILKLSMSEVTRRARELAGAVLGATAMLHAYDREERRRLDEELGIPGHGVLTEMTLFSPAPSIYGGTDQIQRNLLAERVLGLPRDPSAERA